MQYLDIIEAESDVNVRILSLIVARNFWDVFVKDTAMNISKLRNWWNKQQFFTSLTPNGRGT